VVLACVCGSGLWDYRGDSPFGPGQNGHEFIGVVEDVGPDERIIALSRHADRQQLATEFGATDIVAERAEQAGGAGQGAHRRRAR
jgi:threonine dehydrogenase-like Zn-dependent dehydrogenase